MLVVHITKTGLSVPVDLSEYQKRFLGLYTFFDFEQLQK
jgi:hypothetical protein